ncbi:MAG: MFS transporter [Deltaproteobacteria bacterium]|nr:MFS transporter [Deltaproteobacteria bacterium]
MNHPKEDSFLSQVGPPLFLVGIFLVNFLSRIILSPLMPTVKEDLRIGHDEAGSFFFLITLGYCTGLLLSGFISSRFKHRRAIIFSSFAVGAALFLISSIRDLWGIRLGLAVMGLAAGFYLPSGISTLTSLVSQRHWGKALALHELAPNLGFIVAPILTEVLLGWCSWQGILAVVGVASFVAGGIFILKGKGGDFYGAAPDLRTLKGVLKEPSFLLMVVFFSLGVGSSFSIYSMVPLYLVSEKGMDRTWANTLLALSRIAPVATAFLAGWMTDRLGAKKTLKVVFLTAGIATAMIGVVPLPWIIPIIFLQPILATAFFPAGFAALAKVGSPHMKNVAVSLTVPLGFLIGGGAGTACLGVAGEAKLFFLGFILFGGLISGGAGLVRYLKLVDDKR